MGISENLKKGTSEMLILFLLEKEDMYGYQLAQELREKSDGYFVMPEGSLYPTLYRLIDKGVVSDRQEIVGKRLRKYYHLEPSGKEYLKSIISEYRAINLGIQKVLGENVLKDICE
ncbi:MAG: PadR family transcriptional regulator [Acutalibacteraceae bacterium]